MNDYSNIPSSILNKLHLKLHTVQNHPLCIIKNVIYEYFKTLPEFENFTTHDNLSNIVSTTSNFDDLLIGPDHPSRKKSDTYYLNETTVLRSQTSAHQCELMRKSEKSFLVTGDVYRKDEIDKCHYNIFHQMEGVKILENTTHADIEFAEMTLKNVLMKLLNYLFPSCEYRFNTDYFPFTEPSFEVEVKYEGKWLEILGCGVIHRTILNNLGIHEIGFAFGFGLERIAMILFKINDIRLFWTNSPKFSNQFDSNIDFRLIKFKPFSKLDSIHKDISFYIHMDQIYLTNDNTFEWSMLNDFNDIVRDVCGDSIENVSILDKYFNKKINKYSHTFRLTFSPNSDITNSADFSNLANEYMNKLGTVLLEKINLEPRFLITK